MTGSVFVRAFRESGGVQRDIPISLEELEPLGARTSSARSTGPLTTGTLWTYTGGIRIHGIFGIVRTEIQAQATTCQLTVQNDALSAVNLCLTANLTGDTVGTLYHLPNGSGTALQVHDGGADNNSNALTVPIASICTASTGVIDWYLLWEPISDDASVSAA